MDPDKEVEIRAQERERMRLEVIPQVRAATRARCAARSLGVAEETDTRD
jgi:hypothetical protein